MSSSKDCLKWKPEKNKKTTGNLKTYFKHFSNFHKAHKRILNKVCLMQQARALNRNSINQKAQLILAEIV